MIKTLIVDDEIYVRKGLISVLPWEKFGFKIVGEASGGERALEFLKDNRVDVVFMDLTMPGMSGFELMKETRSGHPGVKTVVLTCHQDFGFIQDAMRLGAIDYIVKTQLEKEKLDDVLERIANRIKLDNQDRNGEFEPTYENEQGKRYSEEVVAAIHNAVRYMNERLFEGIHQEEVAKAVNMSRGYFSMCFKDIAGKSFSDYLRNLKIGAAESLLRKTSKPVYVIADQLGFQDEKYFSKLFREQNGMTPSEYRERSR
ncbi:response regulator transcription factor [Paenibacillus sacheonensis]|uniref:Response regulator n=1 Tax=Paenibacillus sacheonensis TaxID=742054 RepID=A0A7X5BYL9_9BACL|nr:response regulator [Paenibacillus sacheonensis]MBM7565486.1 YesN/AraC family two-component response regulator [Paenibacillus sacheonensis]NBC69586.1 response regulator [Paenibacillus sacheonensis]